MNPNLENQKYQTQPETQKDTSQQIPVNGFQQIVDMLRVADPAFRESLLRRLAQRDPNLAHTLRLEL